MIFLPFDNTYARLPERFFTKANPTPVEKPTLFSFNQDLAKDLGITDLPENNDAEYFSGNQIIEGSEPIAMAYSGHQFGYFAPVLGDGRAILLGEVNSTTNIHYDIQLKGAGRTSWSRGGDGRSALGPVIREYLLSEAMHKLGVPTTRALAAVTTGEPVLRNGILPGGILTRVAKGFVRIGTFQYFASRGNIDDLKILADYVIDRHYPEIRNIETGNANPYSALLNAVVDKQAQLTIDYGPCAFMDEFSHSQLYSSIDHQGRYAYKNQPQIGQWNLIRFAETLLPLFKEYVTAEQGKAEEVVVLVAQEALNKYEGLYKQYWLNEMRQKLGMEKTEFALSPEKVLEQNLKSTGDTKNNTPIINDEEQFKAYQKNVNDHALVSRLLDIMQEGKADFTLVFYHISQDIHQLENVRNLFDKPEEFDTWAKKWQKRLTEENTNTEEQQSLMQSVNPVYIPRNHQVEAAIIAAEDNNDFTKFEELHKVLQSPFKLQEGMDDYLKSPKPEEVVLQTFCGT